jgi:hypothetical protein
MKESFRGGRGGGAAGTRVQVTKYTPGLKGYQKRNVDDQGEGGEVCEVCRNVDLWSRGLVVSLYMLKSVRYNRLGGN